MNVEIILNSFTLVAMSEMGDKTQLLAFSLASRFRKPWIILAGILTATLVNHAIASEMGSLFSERLTEKWLSLILTIIFFGFALWTLKPDTYEASSHHSTHYGAFFSTVFLFFLAEMGDKTQLATLALGAKYQSSVQVTLGTTLGMLFSDGLAVFLGEKLSDKINMTWVRRIAALLFFLFGCLSFLTFYHSLKT